MEKGGVLAAPMARLPPLSDCYGATAARGHGGPPANHAVLVRDICVSWRDGRRWPVAVERARATVSETGRNLDSKARRRASERQIRGRERDLPLSLLHMLLPYWASRTGGPPYGRHRERYKLAPDGPPDVRGPRLARPASWRSQKAAGMDRKQWCCSLASHAQARSASRLLIQSRGLRDAVLEMACPRGPGATLKRV